MRRNVGLLLVVLLASPCGCATKAGGPGGQVQPVREGEDPAFAAAAHMLQERFPPRYRATHRAIISVRGRQFVCDGFLTVSPNEGWHLALVSTLGLITDVRVRADGTTEVAKVTPLFREDWSRQHVARELRWLFGPPPPLQPLGRLGDGRLVLAGADRMENLQVRYLCSPDGARWEEIEVFAGRRRVCHARVGGYGPVAGYGREVPMEIELDAKSHGLHLRVAAVSVMEAPTAEATR